MAGWFNLTLDVEGMEVVNQELHTLEAMGARPAYCDLLSHNREGEPFNNAQLAHWHAEPSGRARYPKRDVLSLKKDELDVVAQKCLDEIVKEMDRQFKRSARYQKKLAAGKPLKPPPNKAKLAEQRQAKAFKAAMKAWMDFCAEHIERKEGAVGIIAELSENYKPVKLELVGFTDPPLKRSGQLLENLDSGGTAVSRIRIKRK